VIPDGWPAVAAGLPVPAQSTVTGMGGGLRVASFATLD